MLDSLIRAKATPMLEGMVPKISQHGLTANNLTLIGFALGFTGCFLVGMQLYPVGLVFLLLALLFDGLDGAVARIKGETELGAFLDMICGVVLFAAFPFFFMLSAPGHSMAAGILLFSYLVMGMINLSYDFFAQRKGAPPAKGGLVENSEIAIFMIASCLYPPGFAGFAALFALLCLATAFIRLAATVKLLKV